MINLKLDKQGRKFYMKKGILIFFALSILLCAASCFFINLKGKAKAYQKFGLFCSYFDTSETLLVNYYNQIKIDTIYEYNNNFYNYKSSEIQTFINTIGTYDCDILLLTKELLEKNKDMFIKIDTIFDKTKFEIFDNYAIKAYDYQTKTGLFARFFKSPCEEDFYLAINQNSYHYLSDKENCTDFAYTYIKKLVEL